MISESVEVQNFAQLTALFIFKLNAWIFSHSHALFVADLNGFSLELFNFKLSSMCEKKKMNPLLRLIRVLLWHIENKMGDVQKTLSYWIEAYQNASLIIESNSAFPNSCFQVAVCGVSPATWNISTKIPLWTSSAAFC